MKCIVRLHQLYLLQSDVIRMLCEKSFERESLLEWFGLNQNFQALQCKQLVAMVQHFLR